MVLEVESSLFSHCLPPAPQEQWAHLKWAHFKWAHFKWYMLGRHIQLLDSSDTEHLCYCRNFWWNRWFGEWLKLSGEGWPLWGLGKPWDMHEGTRRPEEKVMAIQIGHHDSCNVVLGLLTTNSLSNLGKCIKFLQSLVYFSGKKNLGSIRASQTCTYLYTWIIWRSYKKCEFRGSRWLRDWHA